MEDNNIWFYIIAAVIYFLTRKKKKRQQQPQASDQSTSTKTNRPQQNQKPVLFEDLLKEVTEGRAEGAASQELVEERKQQSVYNEEMPHKELKAEKIRHFADEESRKVYEESIARAQVFESDRGRQFAPNDHYVSKKMFKNADVEDELTLADEIWEGLQDSSNVRKAIVYSEILTKKY